ncbi:MAG TPA: sigma-54-dependent Fis family transcriptional regulator [Myxococcaceae bacterium]|nr:sigma-54-dependent Fis family transcriptional regulator [Myxococcaceae bacterium]
MKVADLDLRELLDFEPKGGVIRFAGQRAVILDTVALGLLRRELISTVGLTAARGVLTRFGYAHGWRTAETMKTCIPWDTDDDWRKAGGRLHRLSGQVLFEPVKGEPGAPRPFADAIWHESYEAEQHLLHLGQAEEPVCWTLCGFASGYLSYATGRQIYCLEDRCRGKGDSVCSMVGRPRDGFEPSQAAWYETACMESTLAQVTDALKQAEQKLETRKRELRQARGEESFGSLVARSEGMRKVLELARRVARVDSTVLVTGESGTGKEVIARYIHGESARVARPFVAINCAAVPEGLLESELFGHARGAFTGASQDRPGLFEAAHGGTLFLDEVGEVPMPMQAKLLRVLQEREVRRVGENKSRSVDVRVVAATNRDLGAEVVAGRFRQDLYYRLRVIELKLPPLRERKDDILPLARNFLTDLAKRIGSKVSGFSPGAANQLLRYAWPGNVRELENAVERAVVLASGSRITEEDLPEEVSAAVPVSYHPGDVRSLGEMERDYILAVLHATGGNKAKAAAQLKIGTATLFRKLKQYGEEAR